MSGDGKRYGFAHGCNTCHVSASTVGSWLIIVMDMGFTTNVFHRAPYAPTEMSGDGKTRFCQNQVSQYRRNLAIIIRGIVWTNRDMITVKITAMGQMVITVYCGIVI